MKILILQFSDLHIEKAGDLPNAIYNSIKKSISNESIGQCDKLIVLFTGDIAQSGQPEQYTEARRLINCIITASKELNLTNGYINFFSVPGNHDVDQSQVIEDGFTYTKQSEMYGIFKKEYEKILSNGISRLQSFFEFSKKTSLSTVEPVYKKCTVNVNEVIIDIHLLNTTIHSLDKKGRINKGEHYVPEHIIQHINQKTKAEYSFLLMHHEPSWFFEMIKQELEQTINSKHMIVFSGHNHHTESGYTKVNGVGSQYFFHGGCMADKGDWANSEFNMFVLDTETRILTHKAMQFNEYYSVYLEKSSFDQRIEVNSAYELTDDAVEKYVYLKNGYGYIDSNSIFVFPRIKRQHLRDKNNILEILSFDRLIQQIEEQRRIEISGLDLSGKSTLLYQLFQHYYKVKYVIFCRVEDISSGNRNRILKTIFEDTYGTEQKKYDYFKQAPKDEKVILIDDLHLVKPSSITSFLNEIEEEFGYIIHTTNISISFNVDSLIDEAFKEKRSFKYSISPFYLDKREELIRKIVSNGQKSESDKEKEQTVTKLMNAMNSQRRYLISTPDTIIRLVNYYIQNQNIESKTESGIFSKVFESTITLALQKNPIPGVNINKMFTIIGKIAYFIHKNKKYPVALAELVGEIDKYSKEYRGKIDGLGFIKVLVDSKILVYIDEVNGYRFNNKNVLAYFIAKEIFVLNDSDTIAECLRLACFGINSSIIQFIVYLSNNTIFLDKIIEYGLAYEKIWDTYNFDSEDVKYLSTSWSQLEERELLARGEAFEKNTALEKDRKIIDSNELGVINLYDYDDETVEEATNQLIRAYQLMIIISSCLPNFEHLMDTQRKVKFIKTIFSLPNRIFYRWSSIVEKNIGQLIDMSSNMDDNDFIQETSPEELLKYIKHVSIELLLQLNMTSISNACRENTCEHLLDHELYNSNDQIYTIQELMVYDNAGKYENFVKLALTAREGWKNQIALGALARTAQKVYLDRKKLQYTQKQRLAGKFGFDLRHQLLSFNRRLNRR